MLLNDSYRNLTIERGIVTNNSKVEGGLVEAFIEGVTSKHYLCHENVLNVVHFKESTSV